MAGTNQKRALQLESLVKRIEDSRPRLGREITVLRRKLDIRSRLKSTVLQKPWLLFGGSVGAGLLLTRVFRRRKSTVIADTVVVKKRKWTAVVLSAVITFLQPWIKHVVTSELQRRLKANAFRPGGRSE